MTWSQLADLAAAANVRRLDTKSGSERSMPCLRNSRHEFPIVSLR
jgi:hypothetical protein